jgi:predicted phosphoribosyltransferase/pimeloyl-ACP methyl ester carboxylesterase
MDFVDRQDAGRRLAEALRPFAAERPVVVALPRGGVPVALEIARSLRVPMDFLAVRKLGAPGNPELGVGAISEDGGNLLDEGMARRLGMTRELLADTVERESLELRRRIERYRQGHAPVDVAGRTVILVDDGLATGVSALTAIRTLRRRGARAVIVAVPVGSSDALTLIREDADDVVCLLSPADFGSVGRWYEDFAPVPDEQVISLLDAAGPPERPRAVTLDLVGVELTGHLVVPALSRGLVLLTHGAGARRGPRDAALASFLQRAGYATLVVDLLTVDEIAGPHPVLDVPLLARRLEFATRWAQAALGSTAQPVGYLGTSTGAAAALHAASGEGERVGAVVSCAGRPDLAADRLPRVTAPTLLIVGSADPEILELNRQAARLLTCPYRLSVVRGAGHRFERSGTTEQAARLAADWFDAHLLATHRPAEAATGT